VGLASSDPFGAVQSAVLYVSGKLAELPSTLKPMPTNYCWLTWKITKGRALLGLCVFDWVTNSEEDWKAPCDGFMMLLVASWRRKANKSSSQTKGCAYGLILLPSGDKSQYRRVGFFYFGKGPGYSRDSPWNNRLFKGKQVQKIQLI
jgi:hypothetical protein